MVTRSKDGIFMRRHFADLSHVSASALHQALFTTKEPKGFKSAAKDPKWFAAMCDEMKALKLNATWDLVPRPTKSNIVEDSILTGNNANLIRLFISCLNKEFLITILANSTISLDLRFPIMIQVSSVLHSLNCKNIFRLWKRSSATIVKGTLSYGISFLHAPSPTILGYSDADWARCIETRRSNYGYSIFLGGNLVLMECNEKPTVFSLSVRESEYRLSEPPASEIEQLPQLRTTVSLTFAVSDAFLYEESFSSDFENLQSKDMGWGVDFMERKSGRSLPIYKTGKEIGEFGVENGAILSCQRIPPYHWVGEGEHQENTCIGEICRGTIGAEGGGANDN
ncbi:putative zinc finger, CCHC-type containing protein [Tanacetum coccineum]